MHVAPLLQPVPRSIFQLGCRQACISPHTPTALRSQYKATGPASRAQRSRYPKGTSSLVPTPLTFSETPCSPAPHHQVPPMAPHSPSPPGQGEGAPGLITWSPQYVTAGPRLSQTTLPPSRRGGNDAEGAETHPGGRFHFLCIS